MTITPAAEATGAAKPVSKGQQMGRHRCAKRNVVEPSGRAARKMRRGRSAAPRFPGRDRQRPHAAEMEGQHTIDGAAHTPEKPKPESVTPPSAEGSASLFRRSCRTRSPSPHRHRPSFPNRSPPGKKAIPKSPMPPCPRRNEDDTDAVDSETSHLSLRYKLVV